MNKRTNKGRCTSSVVGDCEWYCQSNSDNRCVWAKSHGNVLRCSSPMSRGARIAEDACAAGQWTDDPDVIAEVMVSGEKVLAEFLFFSTRPYKAIVFAYFDMFVETWMPDHPTTTALENATPIRIARMQGGAA